MPSKYFSKLPVISYAGQVTRDLTISARVPDAINQNAMAFYPYQLNQGERPDTIANGYYNDVYMTWLVYLANKVVDPYYDWHMSDQAFIDYVTDKYGSIEWAQRKVEFYRINWYDDDSRLSLLQYSALPSTAKKYWSPVNDAVGYPMYYTRKELYWQVNTNRTYVLQVDASNINNLVAGDLVAVSVGGVTIGSAEVTYADPFIVTLKNVFITQDITSTLTTLTTDLDAAPRSTNFSSSSEVSVNGTPVGIPDLELSYWAPVTAWDVEVERNTKNSSIVLIDNNLATTADEALNQAING